MKYKPCLPYVSYGYRFIQAVIKDASNTKINSIEPSYQYIFKFFLFILSSGKWPLYSKISTVRWKVWVTFSLTASAASFFIPFQERLFNIYIQRERGNTSFFTIEYEALIGSLRNGDKIASVCAYISFFIYEGARSTNINSTRGAHNKWASRWH